MLRVKCFCIFKNEVEILEDWLRYHLAVFGDGNIHLINDNSTDECAALLKRFEGRITVERSIVSGPVYKAENISRVMGLYRDQCDLLVPIDADEFICLQNSADPQRIRAAFDQLDPANAGRFKFSFNYVAIPSNTEVSDPLVNLTDFRITSMEFADRQRCELNKSFFSAATFIGSDGGNHRGHTHDDRTEYTDLWLMTFPVRSRSQLENKLCKGAVYNGFWRRFPNNSSHWRKGYNLLREGKLEEYYLTFTKSVPHARRPFFAEQLKRLRASEPIEPLPDPARESFLELTRISNRIGALLSSWVCTAPASHPHFDLSDVQAQSWRVLARDSDAIVRYGMLRCFNPSTFVQFGDSNLLSGVDEAIDLNGLRTEALLLPLTAVGSIARRLAPGDVISVENLAQFESIALNLPPAVIVEVRRPENAAPRDYELLFAPNQMADRQSWQLLFEAAAVPESPPPPPGNLWIRVPQ